MHIQLSLYFKFPSNNIIINTYVRKNTLDEHCKSPLFI